MIPIEIALDLFSPIVRLCVIMVSPAFESSTDKQIHGLLNIVDSSIDTVVNENAESSLRLIQSEDDGIESHIITTEDSPPMRDFTDFFNNLDELVAYGVSKMGAYLNDPHPVFINVIR